MSPTHLTDPKELRFGACLGAFAALALAGLLMFGVMLVASVGHCTGCDPGPAIRREIGLSALIAVGFGAAVGAAGVLIRQPLSRIIGRRLAAILLVLVTIAVAILNVEGLLSIVEHYGYPPEPSPMVISVPANPPAPVKPQGP